MINRNPFCKVRAHSYYKASAIDGFCDRRVVE